MSSVSILFPAQCYEFPGYSPHVNIMTGELYDLADTPVIHSTPDLADLVAFQEQMHPDVLADENATYKDRMDTFLEEVQPNRWELMAELRGMFANKEVAHMILFKRTFKEWRDTDGKLTHATRKFDGLHHARWLSCWGCTSHVSHVSAGSEITHHTEWSHNRCERCSWDLDRESPTMTLIRTVQFLNRVPAGKKRPEGTKQDIREALNKAGLTFFAVNGGKSASRAKLLSTWKMW